MTHGQFFTGAEIQPPAAKTLAKLQNLILCIPKQLEELGFWQSWRPEFEPAKRCLKHNLNKLCDASRFKIWDAQRSQKPILQVVSVYTRSTSKTPKSLPRHPRL